MKAIGFVAFVAIIIGLIIVGPFLTVWALNTLFGLNIEYSFSTWLAVIILHSLLQVKVSTKKD